LGEKKLEANKKSQEIAYQQMGSTIWPCCFQASKQSFNISTSHLAQNLLVVSSFERPLLVKPISRALLDSAVAAFECHHLGTILAAKSCLQSRRESRTLEHKKNSNKLPSGLLSQEAANLQALFFSFFCHQLFFFSLFRQN